MILRDFGALMNFLFDRVRPTLSVRFDKEVRFCGGTKIRNKRRRPRINHVLFGSTWLSRSTFVVVITHVLSTVAAVSQQDRSNSFPAEITPISAFADNNHVDSQSVWPNFEYTTLRCGGGDDENEASEKTVLNEDDEMDAYIESLIASVDLSSSEVDSLGTVQEEDEESLMSIQDKITEPQESPDLKTDATEGFLEKKDDSEIVLLPTDGDIQDTAVAFETKKDKEEVKLIEEKPNDNEMIQNFQRFQNIISASGGDLKRHVEEEIEVKGKSDVTINVPKVNLKKLKKAKNNVTQTEQRQAENPVKTNASIKGKKSKEDTSLKQNEKKVKKIIPKITKKAELKNQLLSKKISSNNNRSVRNDVVEIEKPVQLQSSKDKNVKSIIKESTPLKQNEERVLKTTLNKTNKVAKKRKLPVQKKMNKRDDKLEEKIQIQTNLTALSMSSERNDKPYIDVEGKKAENSSALSSLLNESEHQHQVHSSQQPSSPPISPPLQRRQRQPPPNAIYRFLLYRGRVGHVIVMNLVLLSEWMQVYLPPVARFLSWIVSFVFPNRQRGAFNEENDIERLRSQVNLSRNAAAALSKTRTGRSSKHRKALLRLADEDAMKQLRRLGNVQQAKYERVSQDFMRRHNLGPYVVQTTINPKPTEQKIRGTALSGDQPHQVGTTAKEGENNNWVLEALSRKGMQAQSTLKALQPKIGVELDSKGTAINFGWDFNLRGDKKDSSSFKPKKTKRRTHRLTSASERDTTGDSMFGRLRAAAGANSLMSRSLLGAYPGDAVPPSQAGSADGVITLAQRYGYGDWSDEDEEEEKVAKMPKRRQKHRTHRSSKAGLDLSGGHTLSTYSQNHRQHREFIFQMAPKTQDLQTFRKSSLMELKNQRKDDMFVTQSDDRMRKREPIRIHATMERLNEHRRKTKRDKDR